MSIFFFQAEDGIRDTSVTGVQTCALPIWTVVTSPSPTPIHQLIIVELLQQILAWKQVHAGARVFPDTDLRRSEERRVGKECRSRGSTYDLKKKRLILWEEMYFMK